MASLALSPEDKANISNEIRTAEATTSGEIYVVVAHAADDFRYVPVVWAALAALVSPWPLHLLTSLSTTTILVIQAILFIVVAWGLSHPRIRYRIVPEVISAEAARKQANAQFLAHGVHLTEDRTGVLIYVALLNRRVEIIADAGIHSKVGDAAWQELAAEITAAARTDRLVDGLVSAIRRAGALLSANFPAKAANPNELSDRVVEV
jgi:putative membrane protein